MIKKKANEGTLRTAINLVRELGLLPGMPSSNKIVFDHSKAPEPDALGYVTTEDADQNGTLDTMHIVLPHVDKYLQGVSSSDLQQMKIQDPDRLKQILLPIVEILAHEQGHQKDYRHGEENPFPGGEMVADESARQAVNRISSQATNNKNKNVINRSLSMKKEVISRLLKLANELDEKRETKLADQITDVAEKYAQQEEGVAPKPRGYAEKFYQNQKAPLGEIQIPGDPFSYNIHPESGYYIAKAPNKRYNLLGYRIKPGDPGYAKIRAQALKQGLHSMDDQEESSQLASRGPSKDEMYGRVMVPEAVEGKLTKLTQEFLPSTDASVLKNLRAVDRIRGPAYAARYEQAKANGVPNYGLRVSILRDAIESLKAEGFDTERLEQNLMTLKRQYQELKDLSRKDSNAEDSEGTAKDKDEMSAEASVTADELTKNASINAIFWKPNVKTPFGR